MTSDAHPETTTEPASRAAARGQRALGLVPGVLLTYAITRVIGTIILWLASGEQVATPMTHGETGFWPFMAMWDGQWYQTIAEHGYPETLPRGPDGLVRQNPWAFYPLFPMLCRVLMVIPGVSFPVAGTLVSLACGFGAAVLIGKLLQPRIGTAATYAVVLLFGLFPASVVLQVAYTEALAVLLLAAYLLALQRERWLLATGVALLTGLARPIAVPLGLVTLVAVLLRWRRRHEEPITRTTWASMAAALVGCGVAGLIWPTVAWLGTGERNAYTETMSSWRASHEIEAFTPWWNNAKIYLGPPWAVIALVALVVLILAAVLGPWARRLGWQLRAWSLAYPAYLAAVLDPFTSTIRYLIPLFTLLPVLLGVAGRGDPDAQPVLRSDGWTPPRHALLVLRTAVIAVLFVMLQWLWTVGLYVYFPPTDAPP